MEEKETKAETKVEKSEWILDESSEITIKCDSEYSSIPTKSTVK